MAQKRSTSRSKNISLGAHGSCLGCAAFPDKQPVCKPTIPGRRPKPLEGPVHPGFKGKPLQPKKIVRPRAVVVKSDQNNDLYQPVKKKIVAKKRRVSKKK